MNGFAVGFSLGLASGTAALVTLFFCVFVPTQRGLLPLVTAVHQLDAAVAEQDAQLDYCWRRNAELRADCSSSDPGDLEPEPVEAQWQSSF